jgi:hypothetical protein
VSKKPVGLKGAGFKSGAAPTLRGKKGGMSTAGASNHVPKSTLQWEDNWDDGLTVRCCLPPPLPLPTDKTVTNNWDDGLKVLVFLQTYC